MNVYYNSSFGCLVCPETRMGNTPMRVVIDPVTVLDSGFTTAAQAEYQAVIRSITVKESQGLRSEGLVVK